MGNNELWRYFDRHPDEKNKLADCNLCKKQLSYKTTITNLKQHLKLKHASSYNSLMEHKVSKSTSMAPSTSRTRNRDSTVWLYFNRHDQENKIAECNICKSKLSHKTTITNLKQHLKTKHASAFTEFLEQGEAAVVTDTTYCDDGSSLGSDDAAEELLKVTDVWSYFDTDSSRKAKCIVCKTNVGNEYDELKAHLKDNHPKLLLQILQDKDQNSDAASNDGDDADDNTYTEVVYLDQEQPIENVIKIKEKSKSYPKPIKKRERLHSLHSSDEIPLKRAKADDNDELGAFIKYITCLLKKLPPDVFSNVQAEIINTILKASSQVNSNLANTSIVLGKELVKTSSNIISVDGISSINSSMGQNYTITVEQPSQADSDTERS